MSMKNKSSTRGVENYQCYIRRSAIAEGLRNALSVAVLSTAATVTQLYEKSHLKRFAVGD